MKKVATLVSGHPFLVVLRVENLVEPRISLLLVQKLDQLGSGDRLCLADRLVDVVNVCSWTYSLVYLIEDLVMIYSLAYLIEYLVIIYDDFRVFRESCK